MHLTKIELDPRRRFARKILGSPQVMHAVVMKACDLGRSIDGDGGDPAGSTSEVLSAQSETSTSVGAESSSARAETSAAGRVLWRVDQGDFGVALYVLSPLRPDMSQIEADATSSQVARTLDYEGFLSRLAEGQTWAFRLAANPVHNENRGPNERGKRHVHVTARQQRDWLLRRAEKQGFSIPMVPDESGLTRPGGDGKVKRVETGDNGGLGCDAAQGRSAAAVETFEGSAEQDDDPNDRASLLVVRREKPVFDRKDRETQKSGKVTIGRVVYEGILRIEEVGAFRQMLVNGLGPSKAYGCGLMTLARPRE